MKYSAAAFILQGVSAYNSLSGFNREAMIALEAMGIEPVLVDLVDMPGAQAAVNRAIADYTPRRIIGAYSFSGIGVELGDGSPEGNLWQRLRIPVLSWMLDHPCYIYKRHAAMSGAAVPLYTTNDFMGFMQTYSPSTQRRAMCRFGTFGGGVEPSRRKIDKSETPLIIFPKSVADTGGIEKIWDMLPKILGRTIRNAVDEYWGNTSRSGSVVNSVLVAADAAGLDVRRDIVLFTFLIAQVDNYMRAKKGNILLRELLSLPVRIYGNGVEAYRSDKSRATIMPPMDYAPLQDVIRQSIAVISMNPNMDDDGHDRLYHAFGAGALPISDINPWWQEKFPELLPYSYDFRDKPITAVIEKIVSDAEVAAETGWAVGSRMRTERPFAKVVKEAVDIALMQRYLAFEYASPLDIYIRPDAV